MLPTTSFITSIIVSAWRGSKINDGLIRIVASPQPPMTRPFWRHLPTIVSLKIEYIIVEIFTFVQYFILNLYIRFPYLHELKASNNYLIWAVGQSMAQKVPNPLAALRRDGYLFSSSRSPLSITAPVVFESSIRFCFFMTLTTYQIRVNDYH